MMAGHQNSKRNGTDKKLEHTLLSRYTSYRTSQFLGDTVQYRQFRHYNIPYYVGDKFFKSEWKLNIQYDEQHFQVQYCYTSIGMRNG